MFLTCMPHRLNRVSLSMQDYLRPYITWSGIFFICILLGYGAESRAADYQAITISTLKARAMGMGGAVLGVRDDFPALIYNPAAFTQLRIRPRHKFTILFNPLLPITAANKPDDFHLANKSAWASAGTYVRYFIQGLSYSYSSFTIAGILNEEAVNRTVPSSRFFDSASFYNNHYIILAAHIQLAPSISLAATGSFYRQIINGKTEHRSGNSYGVLITPGHQFLVGICYYAFPKDFTTYRIPQEGFVHESINIGISYHWMRRVLFSLDARNITEESDNADRQFRFGTELSIMSHLALRAGYYHIAPDIGLEKVHHFTFGIGIFNLNYFYRTRNQLRHPDYLLDYSIVHQEQAGTTAEVWHYLSFNFRF